MLWQITLRPPSGPSTAPMLVSGETFQEAAALAMAQAMIPPHLQANTTIIATCLSAEVEA